MHRVRAVSPRTLTARPLRIEITAKTMFSAVAVAAGAWVLVRLAPVALVVVLASFLVGTLNPVVQSLEKRGMKRGHGIALVFAGVFVATGLLLALTIPSLVSQIAALVHEEPVARAKLADLLSQSRVTSKLADSLRNVKYDALLKDAAPAAFEYSTRIVEIVAYCVSAIFLALYAMLDRNRLRGGLYAIVPRRHHIRLSRVLVNLETIVGGYIRGQVLTSALMAGFTFVLLTLCGVKNALALGVFAGVADVLPYVGVILSVGPAVAGALERGPVVVGIVLAAMLAYEELESRILVPRIYGSALKLPSSVVLFSLLVGGTLMGIPGALLALPVAATIRMLVEELRVPLPGEREADPHDVEVDERAQSEYERRARGVPAARAAAIALKITEESAE